MKFNFENVFTITEYEKFVSAVNNRKDYEFEYGKYNDKLSVRIYGRNCDNGCWLPENYLWSIATTDKRKCDYSGSSSPFGVSELKSYTQIIDYVYERFKLVRPETIMLQLSFL